jgi:hypothetical protein
MRFPEPPPPAPEICACCDELAVAGYPHCAHCAVVMCFEDDGDGLALAAELGLTSTTARRIKRDVAEARAKHDARRFWDAGTAVTFAVAS